MTSGALEAGGAGPGNVKLLLVDDHRPNLVALQTILASPDHELVAVSSGAEALRELAARDFALVLLSVQLQGAMDGLETAARIKALEVARRAPVILLTAAEQEDAYATRAYESGAVDLISRPHDPTIIRAKVAVFVDLYEARQQVRSHELRARGEAERLAASLVQADRLQQQFLSTLGNELRPPLNTIIGWIRMLRDGSIREAQRARALETVERNAVAQLALIEEMVDLSRMTGGKLTLELGTVDLMQITHLAVEAIRPSAIEKQVTLFAALESDIAPMSGDADRLRQIVHQLVSNAVSCTPTEGVVTVSLSNVGTDVELAITDTGPEIEPGRAARMFDRTDGSEGTARAAGGLGAGLAIVRHLVELHDGSIRVESVEGGSGGRFIVLIPSHGRMPRTDDEVR
ncbi:MAG: hybrid sensor histidine kinase/response regulator [Deltaproteobacteria bacterium]|nr:hybrid sensor histidine kinase/response regulator [Deltaproteobacteria bacterium]